MLENLHQPQIPLGKNIISVSAEHGADMVKALRTACEFIVEKIRSDVDIILEIKPRTRIERMIRPGVRSAIIGCLEFGRKVRIFDKISTAKLPSLLDDEDEDHRFKADVVAELDSRIGVSSPFVDELEHITRNCFDRGIPPERLIEFLESQEILNMLIDEVLNLHHSRFRSNSLMALVSTAFDSAFHKLNDIAQRNRKLPVTPDIEDKLVQYLDYFRANYDPRDINHTVASFVRQLQEEFPEIDILSWLKKHKSILIEMLRGNKDGDKEANRHIANIVREGYEGRGKQNPEQFIRLNVPLFLQYDSEADTSNGDQQPAYLNRAMEKAGVSKQAFFTIDIAELQYVFDDILPRIQTKTLGMAHLQRKLIDIAVSEVRKRSNHTTVLIVKNGNEHDILQLQNTENLCLRVGDIIRENTIIISSHVDVVNLLADPENIPPEIRQNYLEWFDGAGNLRTGDYHKYLRRIFGVAPKSEEGVKETFDAVKKRAAKVLEQVNFYLDSIGEDMGFPSMVISETVRECNDYATLVKLANTAQTKEERFAARRKIELAILIYSCLQTPRMVYRDRDGEEIKRTLEISGDLRISEESTPLREVEFVETDDGQVYLCDRLDGTITTDVQTEEIKAFELIPARFAGTNCFLLPTIPKTEETPIEQKEYLGKKTLYSMVTKLLHRDQMRAKDVTDLLRMTFVVDSIKDLELLREYIETHYISFGRTLRREDRYGDFIRVSTTHVGSVAKSAEYRSLRYVVDVPVWDGQAEHVYFAPLEIRILLTEDAAKEKSENHHASHKNYEKRRLIKVMERLAPPEICPQLYKTVGPDPNDAFKQQHTVLKNESDFANAA